MKSKIITYFLLSVFLFSAIGIPITLHHCNMMHSVSLKSCGMCEQKTLKCCDNDFEGHKISFVKGSACCDSKIIAEPLNEKYVLSSFDIQKIDLKVLAVTLTSENLLSEIVIKKIITSDISPPNTNSNQIYLFNSVLLI